MYEITWLYTPLSAQIWLMLPLYSHPGPASLPQKIILINNICKGSGSASSVSSLHYWTIMCGSSIVYSRYTARRMVGDSIPLRMSVYSRILLYNPWFTEWRERTAAESLRFVKQRHDSSFSMHSKLMAESVNTVVVFRKWWSCNNGY